MLLLIAICVAMCYCLHCFGLCCYYLQFVLLLVNCVLCYSALLFCVAINCVLCYHVFLFCVAMCRCW